MSGEQQIDCWPPPLVSDKRNELRQIVRAKKTVFKRNYHNGRCLRGISEMQDGYEINLLSSQPAKAKWRELKTLMSKTFQTKLKKARAMKHKKVHSAKHQNNKWNNLWLCAATDCIMKILSPCRMGLSCLFEMSENDHSLPQTNIIVLPFWRLLNKTSDSIPDALKIINNGVREYN